MPGIPYGRIGIAQRYTGHAACDPNRRDLVEGWLRSAVRAGRFGAWDGGYPRYVWHRQDELVFEARQGSPGSGEYHGYPLEPEQRVQGLE